MTLDEIADTVLYERREWFLQRIAGVESVARIKLTPHRQPTDARRKKKDLAALRKAREMMADANAEKTVLLAMDLEIWKRDRKITGGTWTPSDAIEHAEDGILRALSLARGVHLGRLRPGRSPEGVSLTQDSEIVHELLMAWGLHQQPDTTFKHVRRSIAGCRADADYDERNGHSAELRPLPEIYEGTGQIVF